MDSDFDIDHDKAQQKAKLVYIIGKESLTNNLLVNYIKASCEFYCDHKMDMPSCSFFDMHDNEKYDKFFLVDYESMNGHSTANLIVLFKKIRGSAGLGVFNVPCDVNLLLHFLALGAQGAFQDKDPPSRIIMGISAIFQGEYWFPRIVLSKYIQAIRLKSSNIEAREHITQVLSSRERDILIEIGAGKTNEQIAESLFISPNTVRNHLASIYKKLQVKNRLQAALWAPKFK